jgi:hypothetical protein
MKKTMSVVAFMSAMLFAGTAMADQPKADAPKPERGYGKLRLGFGFDFGAAPAPLALELVVHPWEDMLTGHIGVGYNALAFGPTYGLRLDPLAYFARFPVGIIGEWNGGSFSQGTPPGVNTQIKVGYSYNDLMAGLRFGRSRSFEWTFLFGSAWNNFTTNNFSTSNTQSPVGVSVGNPSGSLQLTPIFLTGFHAVWSL